MRGYDVGVLRVLRHEVVEEVLELLLVISERINDGSDERIRKATDLVIALLKELTSNQLGCLLDLPPLPVPIHQHELLELLLLIERPSGA